MLENDHNYAGLLEACLEEFRDGVPPDSHMRCGYVCPECKTSTYVVEIDGMRYPTCHRHVTEFARVEARR